MGVGAISMYNNTSQTVDGGGVWGELDLDTTRHEDAASWTADTTAHDITQDASGTVVVIGTVTATPSATYCAFKARLERDQGGFGFNAVDGTSTRVWCDAAAVKTGTGMMFAAFAGSVGDTYRIGVSEDIAASVFTTGTAVGSNCSAFFAPSDSTLWARGTADVDGSSTYVDITLTAALDDCTTISLASNEITLDAAGDYLILYAVRFKRATSSDQQAACRLVADSGGGYAEIAGSETWQHPGYNSTGDGGANVAGALIYTSAGSGHKVKLQAKSDGVNCDFIADGNSILVLKLPSGWEGFSGYEATAITPGTSLTAVEMDTEYAKSGLTHTGTSASVTLPAEATTCLVIGTFQGADTVGEGHARAMLYLNGSPITASNGYGTGYNSGTKHSGTTALIDGFASSDVLALYGAVSASASAVAGSRLTILRLDNLGDAGGGSAVSASVGFSLAVTAPPSAIGWAASAVGLSLALTAPGYALGYMASTVAAELAVTAPAYALGWMASAAGADFAVSATAGAYGYMASTVALAIDMTAPPAAYGYMAASVGADFTVAATASLDNAIAAAIGLGLAVSGTLTGLGYMTSTVTMDAALTAAMTAYGWLTAALALAVDVTAPAYAIGWVVSSVGVDFAIAAVQGDSPYLVLDGTVYIGHVLLGDVEIGHVASAGVVIGHILTGDTEVP